MSVQKTELTIAPQKDKEEFKKYLHERENAEATIAKYLTDVNTFYTFLKGNYRID